MQPHNTHTSRHAPNKKQYARQDPQTLQKILSRTRLGQLLAKAQQLNQLQHLLTQHLPAGLAEHCKVLNFNACQLIIRVGDSGIAARLRFMAPQLLQHMQAASVEQNKQQLLARISTIRIKVTPSHTVLAAGINSKRLTLPNQSAPKKQAPIALHQVKPKPAPTQASACVNAIVHPRLRNLWQKIIHQRSAE